MISGNMSWLIEVEMKLTLNGMKFGEDDPLLLRKLSKNGNIVIWAQMACDNPMWKEIDW